MRRSLASVAAAAVLIAACGGEDAVSSTTSPGQASTTSTSTTLPQVTTTAAPRPTVAPPNPDLAGLPPIALIGSGADAGSPGIVLVDPGTGEVTRVLADDDDLGEGGGQLAVGPDGRTIYFSRIATACSSDVVAIDTTDLSLERITSGEAPAVSPDGRYLAYALDPVCRRGHDLVVRDLTTGIERTWESELPAGDTELIASIPMISWSPDGRSIVFELVLEDGIETRLLDVTAEGGSLADSRKLGSSSRVAWSSPMFLPAGTIAAVELCCDFNDVSRSVVTLTPSGERSAVLWESMEVRSVLDVDATTGAILALVDRPSGSSAVVALIDGVSTLVAEDVSDAVFVDFEFGS